MTVADIIKQRNISEVVHFTTSNGLIGILSSGHLLAHSELPRTESLAHITHLNCPDRSRDAEYHSYVNLSISRINGSFFSIAKNKWHATKDIYWCIMSFTPDIMTHDGVLFATTNNAYPRTIRAPGELGLNYLFDPKVRQFDTKWVHRSSATPEHYTTCNQAEVLYPNRIPVNFLRRIYLPTAEIISETEAQIGLCAPHILESVELIVDGEKFL